MSGVISGGPTDFDIAQAYRHGLADGQASVQRERALARLNALEEVRAAMPVHDKGEWLIARLDMEISQCRELIDQLGRAAKQVSWEEK